MNERATVYVVIQRGVYRHGIGGVFLDAEKARVAANVLLAQEPDRHHDYEIVRCEIDKIAEMSKDYYPHPADDVIDSLSKSI